MNQHHLSDWGTVLAFASRHAPRLHPKTLLLLLETAAEPDGVMGDHLRGPARDRWRDRRRFLAKNWPSLIETAGSHVRMPDTVRQELPAPAVLAGLARVLRALLQKLPTVAIGILCHATREEPLYRGRIHLLPFCKSHKNCAHELDRLVTLGLLQITLDHGRQRVRLTPAGEALMLGRWGKAAQPSPPQPSRQIARQAA